MFHHLLQGYVIIQIWRGVRGWEDLFLVSTSGELLVLILVCRSLGLIKEYIKIMCLYVILVVFMTKYGSSRVGTNGENEV